jgi:hypothetical protein
VDESVKLSLSEDTSPETIVTKAIEKLIRLEDIHQLNAADVTLYISKLLSVFFKN